MLSKCCNAKIHKQNDSLFCTYCIRILGKDQVRKERKYIYYVLFCFISLFLITNASAPNTKMAISHMPVLKHIEIEKDVELNDSCILLELIKDSCVLPNVAIAQAHIESGFYTSKKTFENKNIFGIKPHKCKYVKGVKNYQAVYHSYKDCIACYCHIQKFYLKSIDGHYAANGDYVNLIKKVR